MIQRGDRPPVDVPNAKVSLADWLLLQIADDEATARAASTNDTGGGSTSAGEHWRWEYTGGRDGRVGDGITDEPVDLTTAEENLSDAADGSAVSLRSVEQYPYRSIPGAGPHIVIYQAEDMLTRDARHIARWDPARVLAECAARRAIVEHYQQAVAAVHRAGDIEEEWGARAYRDGMQDAVGLLAQPFAGRPGWRDEWKVET